MYRVGFLISFHRRRFQYQILKGLVDYPMVMCTRLKNSVGKRGLLDIQRKFPELNTDWLLTGEGEMLNDTSSYIVNSDHHGTSVAGNGNNVNTTSALEKALESLMEQQRLTAKAQEQVDRLLSLMERMTK